MPYACRRCGRISDTALCDGCQGSQRPAGAHWSKKRDRSEQRRFRKWLMLQFGGQCCAVVGGVRCQARDGLQAHHTHGLDDPRGVLLCPVHHRVFDVHAR